MAECIIRSLSLEQVEAGERSPSWYSLTLGRALEQTLRSVPFTFPRLPEEIRLLVYQQLCNNGTWLNPKSLSTYKNLLATAQWVKDEAEPILFKNLKVWLDIRWAEEMPTFVGEMDIYWTIKIPLLRFPDATRHHTKHLCMVAHPEMGAWINGMTLDAYPFNKFEGGALRAAFPGITTLTMISSCTFAKEGFHGLWPVLLQCAIGNFGTIPSLQEINIVKSADEPYERKDLEEDLEANN